MCDLECRGTALRLIDSMPESLATSDGATVAQRHEARTPLWFVPALSMLPLAARRCLVRNPLNGTAMELSSGEYAVLAASEGCQPLLAHEARAALQLSAPAEHRPAFRDLLERCSREGLLMALPDLVANARALQPAPMTAGAIGDEQSAATTGLLRREGTVFQSDRPLF